MRQHVKRLALILTALLILYTGILPTDAQARHDHAWSAWFADPSAPAGCTAGGREMRTCSAEGCPEPIEYRPTAALGHDWGDWQVYQAATCMAGGQNRRVCKRCGAAETMNTPSLGGHVFGGWQSYTPATCTTGGVNSRTCTRCGETEYQNTTALGHDWEHKKKAPSCSDVGVEEDVCKRCHSTKNTVVTAALGHNWGLFHETLAPGCTTQGSEESTCSRCGVKWTRAVAALGHNWGAFVETLAPGCTTPGLETRTCLRCGQTQQRGLPALGHDWGAPVVTTAADCNHTGTATRTCARCGATRTETLPRTKHNWGPWGVAVAPACTTRGTEMRTCGICGRQETRRLRALGHASDGVWVTVRNPSLSRRGLQATTCLRCGGQAKTRTFAPRGYRYDVRTQAFGASALRTQSGLEALSGWLIPVDLSAAGERLAPLLTEDGYLIGAARLSWMPGSLSVRLEQASEPTRLRDAVLRVYASPEEAAQGAGGESVPLGVPVPVSGDKALVSISLIANYYQGNENKSFSENMLLPGGNLTYAQYAQQMADEMARLFGANP